MFATVIAWGKPEPLNKSSAFTFEEDERIMCFMAEERWADAPCQPKDVRAELHKRFAERGSTRRYAEVIRRAAQLGSDKFAKEALEAFPAFASRSGESAAAARARFEHAQFLLRRYFQKRHTAWMPSPARKRKREEKEEDFDDAVAIKRLFEIHQASDNDDGILTPPRKNKKLF